MTTGVVGLGIAAAVGDEAAAVWLAVSGPAASETAGGGDRVLMLTAGTGLICAAGGDLKPVLFARVAGNVVPVDAAAGAGDAAAGTFAGSNGVYAVDV